MNFIASNLLFYFFFIPLIFGADTLVMNQSLTGDQTLVSLAGNFEMGFFRPGKPPNYYIGIWYKKVKTLTIVWVANRETPIFDRFSSKLKINDGNLVLLNESNAPIWSTNMISAVAPASSLVLLDDGNLVLRYGSSSSPPIWQSFDHPTHTFLPGSKLGYNKRTNTGQVITSWKTMENPAAGLFSLEIVPKEKQYVLNCEGYSFISNRCRLWNRENLNNISFVFVSDDSDVEKFELNVKVFSKDLQHHKNDKVRLGTIVGSIAGAVVFVSGLIFLIIIGKKWIWVGRTRMDGLLVAFSYKDLQKATKNFSDKLGGGGFGSVFKGVLRDSSIVAVKKLQSVSQGEKQFRSEVSTIGAIQHVNLVRLRGFCGEGNHKLLVYDYMTNGSLAFHLFYRKQDNVLDWKTRYQIAVGTARGLVYLHEKCRDCIIHCDIKPENILLDANFCPKVADFGLAKLVGRDFSRVLTTIRGTPGYLAPEWLSGVPITPKADVYSYGMLLFELVRGKRNSEKSCEGSSFTFFPSLAANVVMEGGDILSLLDGRLNREANVEEVIQICKVAYWCIQDEEESRPSMSEVERILEGVVDVSMPPFPQSLKFFVDGAEDIPFFNVSSSIFNEPSSIRSSQVQSNISGDSQSKSTSS
ncbi:G-type lectin S-receptor-like serine/threonine-protein kinase At2g19130 [Bidens hawaiensis]|uniref:G-type lectin S-receptor-like serine/threonine-protein kinase At2g19130 n=1 Tax=Bidens hawaiensis TaxID=980011 RepID=UPI00404ADF91